jgi:hypothetical protein
MCIRVHVCLVYASERVSFRTGYSDSHIFFVLVDSDEKSIRENDICPPVIALKLWQITVDVLIRLRRNT